MWLLSGSKAQLPPGKKTSWNSSKSGLEGEEADDADDHDPDRQPGGAAPRSRPGLPPGHGPDHEAERGQGEGLEDDQERPRISQVGGLGCRVEGSAIRPGEREAAGSEDQLAHRSIGQVVHQLRAELEPGGAGRRVQQRVEHQRREQRQQRHAEDRDRGREAGEPLRMEVRVCATSVAGARTVRVAAMRAIVARGSGDPIERAATPLPACAPGATSPR